MHKQAAALIVNSKEGYLHSKSLNDARKYIVFYSLLNQIDYYLFIT